MISVGVEWHHQQMLGRAVRALADQGCAGQEHGEESDAIDQLHHAHEGRDLEIGIELRPDDEGYRWCGDRYWSPEEGRELLGDDILDIDGTSASLGHGSGVHVKLKRGAPSTYHVGLEVWGDIQNKGVAPRIHPGIDLLNGQWYRWQEAGWEQSIADAPGQR
jgi:hypothetical protein